LQLDLEQVGPEQVSPFQVGVAEVGLRQISLMQVSVLQIGPTFESSSLKSLLPLYGPSHLSLFVEAIRKFLALT
jgi:hypothetical protein